MKQRNGAAKKRGSKETGQQRGEEAKGRESKETRKQRGEEAKGTRGPLALLPYYSGSYAGSRIQATSLHALQSPPRMLLEQCYNSIHLA